MDKLEIIVINDNSSDRTGHIIEQFAQKDPRIKPLHLKPPHAAKGKPNALNQGLKLAPAAVVVPFTYTSLLWAILLGWLFFADLPTPLMLLGAGIIVASGLFVLHRERQIKQA